MTGLCAGAHAQDANERLVEIVYLHDIAPPPSDAMAPPPSDATPPIDAVEALAEKVEDAVVGDVD